VNKASTWAHAHLDESLATKLIARAGLGDIDAKVRSGERLSFDDGMRLYETPHLAAVGLMAHRCARRATAGAPTTTSTSTSTTPTSASTRASSARLPPRKARSAAT